MIEKRHQYSVRRFKYIEPSKKFNSFYYYSISRVEEFALYTEKNAIVKFENEYYMYSGVSDYASICKNNSRIEIEKGRNIIHTIIDKQ